jgi:lysophospholipase L1-like esterase
MKCIKVVLGVVLVLAIIAGMYDVLRGVSTDAAVQSNGRQTYVALGDSVAAGLGLQGSKQAGACGRSTEAYPHQVAQQLNLKLVAVACSGATTQTMLSSQLAALTQRPSLITATIGANDLGWTQLLAKCYKATCGTPQDTAFVNAKLATVSNNIHTLLDTVRKEPVAPRVVLTGYYQVLPASKKGCPRVDALEANEFTWWRDQEDKLNQTIKQATVGYGFARFAPVDFSEHDICMFGDSSWIQSLGSTAPFHPTAIGQAVIAGAVVTAR